MKYYEVRFTIESPENQQQDACDILSAMAGEAGFETFEDTALGITGYVQQALFDRSLLEQLITEFPLPDSRITFDVCEAEDKDWNEQWEQEGFQPIIIDNRCLIHDGRHTGDTAITDYEYSIEIDARLAFGTGTHETTRMIVGTLLDFDLQGKRVLDCGTGTGILSIAALKMGANSAIGYDIDEWSVDNARHNAVINHVDDRFMSLLGDSSILNKVEGTFDIVMANINRNILLEDMPVFRQKMTSGSILILSGFYQTDIPMLATKATELFMTVIAEKEDNGWGCLVLNVNSI